MRVLLRRRHHLRLHGTKLLVVRAAEARLPDSELAVLDPAHPDQPRILGTIPGLPFFSASWVRR